MIAELKRIEVVKVDSHQNSILDCFVVRLSMTFNEGSMIPMEEDFRPKIQKFSGIEVDRLKGGRVICISRF